MKHIKLFESFSEERVLVIVDVQKSFLKFFNKKYLNELSNYCKDFDIVYQIFDNHVDGKHPDKDYLYDNNPDIEDKSDLYKFPNQVDCIEKRYNYDVDVDFYKEILSKETYNEVKNKETNNLLVRGDSFKTEKGTILVYIGNNHKWYHVGKKMIDLFQNLKNKYVVIVGGAKDECILDIIVAAKSFGLEIFKNEKYIYSATNCPIN